MPYVKVMGSIRQISFNPGGVLFVPVCDWFSDTQSWICKYFYCPHQLFMLHPGTISNLITLQKKIIFTVTNIAEMVINIFAIRNANP